MRLQRKITYCARAYRSCSAGSPPEDWKADFGTKRVTYVCEMTNKNNQGPSILVDSISTAALQIFAEKGVEQATTNKIAERAGVGIGSFYRYFKDKHSLFECLVDFIIVSQRSNLENKLKNSIGATLEDLGSLMAATAFDGLMEKGPFLRVLYRQILGRGNLAVLIRSRQKIAKIFTHHLETYYADQVDLSRIGPAMEILIHAFTGVLMTTVSGHGAGSNTTVRRELMAMSSSYLAALKLKPQ